MLRFRLAFVLFALVAFGCDEPQLYVPYGDGGVNDASIDGNATGDGAVLNAAITLAGANPLVVTASTDVTVRVLVLVDDHAVEGVTVTFAIDGAAADSSLDRTSATTNADGIVEVTVRGGTIPTSFQLRVTVDGAPAQYVAVNVAGATGLVPAP